MVVDDENTRRECIKYPKKQLLTPWTFTPNKAFHVKQIHEKLCALGRTTKIFFNIFIDPTLERTIQSDTLDNNVLKRIKYRFGAMMNSRNDINSL